ncbi:transcriptional regulator with XRE-family HTH domain [Xanthomonas arboricola]|uniref:Helix-turn-helix domain-containing protein n=1 Tax=Xanthomonas cucurbitae TaxID=56453 RepID=A0ABY7YA71_9XANT|nr:helix-turn-helix transcriptional regulator [Xanthomonas cucurbitae]WDM66896.1 helix-turn-helix domain-containing protein [Xanthomonas cucurbitae]WDM70773.1 helix-turn-helix domain-containing protein [Xanthomonas cucurbitae]
MSQRAYAEKLGVPLKTYQTYEQGKREPDLRTLEAIWDQGYDLHWLLFGSEEDSEKPLRYKGSSPDEAVGHALSQSPRLESLTLAIQLAEEALDGGRLEPADYAQLVSLIHDALVNGLPSAQVLAFARPAARGIGETEHGRRDVGGSGKKAAR